MFENELVNTTEFGNKATSEEAYKSFLERMSINLEDFPFKVKTGKLDAGREVIFTVRSWGFYEASKNGWRIFIAYYYPGMKHTVQYQWHVGSAGTAFGKPEKFEWINGR